MQIDRCAELGPLLDPCRTAAGLPLGVALDRLPVRSVLDAPTAEQVRFLKVQRRLQFTDDVQFRHLGVHTSVQWHNWMEKQLADAASCDEVIDFDGGCGRIFAPTAALLADDEPGAAGAAAGWVNWVRGWGCGCRCGVGCGCAGAGLYWSDGVVALPVADSRLPPVVCSPLIVVCTVTNPFRLVVLTEALVGLNWYTLLGVRAAVSIKLWSAFSSTFSMIGWRASGGRVSIMPTIVSAGPTITLSVAVSPAANGSPLADEGCCWCWCCCCCWELEQGHVAV
uniref:Uncharacterized protein n=1 Tax=Anopheles coluzzii TaxID=1518534 RepID=A0A8W7PWJ2_ANOCL